MEFGVSYTTYTCRRSREAKWLAKEEEEIDTRNWKGREIRQRGKSGQKEAKDVSEIANNIIKRKS